MVERFSLVKNDIGWWFDSFRTRHIYFPNIAMDLKRLWIRVSHVIVPFLRTLSSCSNRVNKLKCHFSTSLFCLLLFARPSFNAKGMTKNLIICCLAMTIFYWAWKYEKNGRIRVNTALYENYFIFFGNSEDLRFTDREALE